MRNIVVVIAGLFTAITPTAAQIQFVDITESAGIDFRYINGASGEKFMLEAVGSGAAFFDADRDGFIANLGFEVLK